MSSSLVVSALSFLIGSPRLRQPCTHRSLQTWKQLHTRPSCGIVIAASAHLSKDIVARQATITSLRELMPRLFRQ